MKRATSPQQASLEHAAMLGKQIQQSMPDLACEPAIGFALAAADRRRGLAQQAERFYLTQSRGMGRDAWQVCALGEQWLAHPTGEPPKPILHCAVAPSKPRLDGRLDDAVWQEANPAELKSRLGDDADWPGLALVAHDQEFLYLAIHCRQAPGVDYEPTGGVRPRDADLASRDRVDVYLDLDRDYVTWYHLAIDDRGWTCEDCWGDRAWDPTWFVAARTDSGTWTIEAAIPLEQLTGVAPGPKQVWAIGIQRTVPGLGFQCWHPGSSVRVRPEEFGYMVFE